MVEHLLSLDGGFSGTKDMSYMLLEAIDPYYDNTSSGAIMLVVLSIVALIVSVPGLVWHIKNQNIAAASMIGWIVLLNFMNVLNALIWPNDNVGHWWDGQIFCDIEIKLQIASTMGLVGSLVCIMRFLAQAFDTANLRLVPSKGQRIRRLVLEIVLCGGLPLLIALLHFVLQPLRYYVFAIAGCKPSYSSSWYTILLGYVWPPVICILAGYYAVVLAVRIYRYRRDFASALGNSSSGMNKSRFIRLCASSMTVFIVVLPLQGYALYINVISTMGDVWNPESWQTIVYVPTFGMVFPDHWIRVGIAFPVFLCFAWGSDANSIYRSWLRILGLTKLFPSLAQSDRESITSPSGHKKNRLLSNFSKTTTAFSKAKSLFSSRGKHSSTFNSNLSSRNSPPQTHLELGNLDIERNAISGGSLGMPLDLGAQTKSWEVAQRALGYEAEVVGRLA